MPYCGYRGWRVFYWRRVCYRSYLRPYPPWPATQTIVVRVLEDRVADRVTIGAPSPVRVSFPGGALEQSPVTLTITVTVTADESSILTLTAGGRTVRAASPLTVAPLSGSAVLTVTTPTDDHRYRGALTVSAEKGVIVLLNTVPLEEYLLSVVPGELSTRETAALKAQAILCRTFALKNRKRHTGCDLCDLTHCQYYGGVDTETAAGTRAVTETAGLTSTSAANRPRSSTIPAPAA